MSRKLKVSASVLNLSLHPHDKEKYASYLGAVFKARAVGQVHGDRLGMVSLVDSREKSSDKITGVVTTFLKVDKEGTWFNTESLADASEDQVAKVQIPDNLKPNASAYYFDFDTAKHRLYIQRYSKGSVLTPNSALRLFRGLASNNQVMALFGEAKISLVQQKESLKKLFSIPRIKEINITILRPNPDIFVENFEASVEAHMGQINARSLRISYRAEPGGSLVPTSEIEEVGETALNNGEVEVVGRDDSGAVRRSTEDFPLTMQTTYEPDQTSERSAFFRLVRGANQQDG